MIILRRVYYPQNNQIINVTIPRCYNFQKEFHKNAKEVETKLNIHGHTGTMVSLIENNEVMVRKSEYDDMGHGISSLPFKNSDVIDWIFSKHLK